MAKFNKLRTNFISRSIPKRGVFDSDQYNSGQQELSTDISNITTRWNTELYPILDSLCKGTEETRWSGATDVPSPLEDGLDGCSLLVDMDAEVSTETSNIYWDTELDRPRTIKETLFLINNSLSNMYDELSTNISSVSNGLTGDQWTRIGKWAKDGTSSSDPSSIDGKVNTNTTTINNLKNNLALDIYDVGSFPDSTGLTYSIKEMLSSILALHGGTWNSNDTLAHTNLNTWLGRTNDSETTPSYTSNYNITSTSKIETAIGELDLETSRINTFIGKTDKALGNTTNYGTTTYVVANVTDSLEAAIGKLDTEFSYVWSFIGKGTSGAENRNYSSTNYIFDSESLESGISRLDAQVKSDNTEASYIRGFTGKTGAGSESPTYTNTHAVTQSSNLESAIGQLSQELQYVNAYTGKPSAGNNTPQYSSNNIIDDGDTLLQSLVELDQEAGYVNTFIGKAAGSEYPTYGGTVYIVANNDPLETAIGKLEVEAKQSRDFLGKGATSAHSYSSLRYITNSYSHEYAISVLDSNLYNQSLEQGYVNTFIGKAAGNELPTYTSIRMVGVNDNVETAISKLDQNAAKRLEHSFSSHTDINTPIVWTHNQSVTYPLIQVVDKGVGGDYGVIADEVYEYERQHGLVTTDAFVSVEFISNSVLHVYTNIVTGVIVGVF